MKRFIAVLFVVFAFAGFSYVSAIADPGKACEKRGKGGDCCAILETFKLTKEQKAKIDEYRDECKKAMIKTTADMKAAKVDLNALLRKDSIDKSAVDAKVNEIGDGVKKIIKTKTDCKIKVMSVLDAEQKKAFLEAAFKMDDDHDCGEGKGHDCDKGKHDCGKGKPECCEKQMDCCKDGGKDCCEKGKPECCVKQMDCCKNGGSECCEKAKKACDKK